MDHLDSNLHQTILTSLACNLASTSSQDDLSLLTSSFSSSQPVTNGLVNGVLSRLGVNGSTTQQENEQEPLTLYQVDNIVAFSEFTKQATPEVQHLEQVLTLLRAAPLWSLEPALGVQASQDWAPADQLANALVGSALTMTDAGVGDRTATLKVVGEYQKALLDQVEAAEGHRIISYLLPSLNGARRAIKSSPLVYQHTDIPPSATTVPTQPTLDSITSALTFEWDLTTEGGRTSLATLQQYETIEKGLSPGLIILCDLENQTQAWCSALTTTTDEGTPPTLKRGWEALLDRKANELGNGAEEKAKTSLWKALEVWSSTLSTLEKVDVETGADPYSFDILLANLKLVTVASIATGSPSTALFTILEGLLVPPTTVTDAPLQIGAVECLQVLAYSFPTTVSQSSSLIRRFILSPSPVFEQEKDELSPSPTMLSAVHCYSSLISLVGDPALRQSAIQSLLNHYSAPDRDSVSRAHISVSKERKETDDEDKSDEKSNSNETLNDPQRNTVSVNVVHGVARLALEFKEEQTYRLVASMLLQRLGNRDPIVDGAIMFELTELVYVLDDDTVLDIFKAICDASKGLEQDDPMTKATLTAQTRLASAAASRKTLHLAYLVATLSHFIDKGMDTGGRKISRTVRSSYLLELIPVLDTFLTESNFDPRQELDTALVSLFRGTWYLCLLSGFLSGDRIADWQRAALIRIAQHTPSLLRGVRDDFVETELEFNSILTSATHVIAPDAVRVILSGAVSQQASNARSLSTPQVIFLTTVLQLESLRAEAGQPSTMLSYFHVDGVNNNIPMFTTLSSIADKVNDTFISHFSSRVTSQSMDDNVYAEVREILLECCHPMSKVRTIAVRYLNDLFSSFPSLLCNGDVVTVLLELLTCLRRACLAEFTDEYTPVYSFHSARANFSVSLPDDYPTRNNVLLDLHRFGRAWLKSAVARAPLEMRGLLQDYINLPTPEFHSAAFADDEMGKSVAIDLIRMSPSNGREASLPSWGEWKADSSSSFARTFGAKSFYGGEASQSPDGGRQGILQELEKLKDQLDKHKLQYKLADLRQVFYRCAGHVVKAEKPDLDILHEVVDLPVRIFTEGSIGAGQEVWTWIADARPELEARLMIEVTEAWNATIIRKQGFFGSVVNRQNPLEQETQYTPTDKDAMTKEYLLATRQLQPHTILLSFLLSRFQAFRYRDAELVQACTRLILRSTAARANWSTHQLARELRTRLLSFGFDVLLGNRAESVVQSNVRSGLYDAALNWFELAPGWSFGSNRIQLKADLQALEELIAVVKLDRPVYDFVLSSINNSDARSNSSGFIAAKTAAAHQSNRQLLLITLLENETDRLKLWINPLMDAKRGPVPARTTIPEATWRKIVRIAWDNWPAVAVQLPERAKVPAVAAELTRLVRSDPVRVQGVSDALAYFIGDSVASDTRKHLRHLLFWAPVPVIQALRFLFPKFGGDPILLQYALRVLEHHPIEVTFFYIPQVVQALRTDSLGYAERFIFETSKISQLFCHQIIWNMKANAYRGDDGEVADPMKPTLDRLVDMIVNSLSGDAKEFFQREFSFFDEVTSISAKLKPFIKASKLEKKAKIDEEMAKIKVDPGVYLPSNPDGVVVDIDRKSGRPLQSHAKAPFMATFKVRRDRKTGSDVDLESQDALISAEQGDGPTEKSRTFDTWQAAIFKVGDDCRQDVLALQIIAMHKNIFTSLGLDLLVTPYRVTATGAGCGVIDVVPNATSRDEMGRAKVNDLQSFFILKYGNPDTVSFQKARINFIQSMAAYSLLCYIVQIKDRHNGNIMIDGRGCITHIDFGFLFDIDNLADQSPFVQQGVKFEPNSFKLTHEMVVLMGGKDSVGFRQFTELTVKAFLACRPYGQAVADTTSLMLAAEFPSFKGEPTIQRLTERFRLDLTEADAADYMRGVVNNAYQNVRSLVYDEFQLKTNGIPYVR